MNIIAGFIIFVLGTLMIIKSEWLLENFGRIEFFERKLATSGGSRLGYKLFGLLIVFIGILIFTNLIGNFLGWVLSPLLRYSQNLKQ